MTYAEHSEHHHYVSVIDGPRYGLLLGPYPTRREAERNVERARIKAREVNDRAIWYGYGTCRVTTGSPRPGRFNDLIGMTT